MNAAFSLPSLGVPEAQKRSFSEADVHAKLFEPDMQALGFPPRTATQADGEYFLEQRALAIRRLRSREGLRGRGSFDGLYLVGNSPVLLCELKRYDGLSTPAAMAKAEEQLIGYARSEDFAVPPPFLLLYCGDPTRTRFFRRRLMADGTLLDSAEYEELPELWTWERVKASQAAGSFAVEEVESDRLLQILVHHLGAIEDTLRADVRHAVEVVADGGPPAILTPFGHWLREHPQAERRMRELYERKRAEVPGKDEQVTEEMVTQAALNYLNKVFFLSLCEDRNLPGFYRILREFLPTTRAQTKPTTAAVFMALLRRKLLDTTDDWGGEDERAYRTLRHELAGDIREHVIEQNNWWELIRVAFDLAEERFPLVYREDAYDDFRPDTATVADLVYDLSTKSFARLTNRAVGDIYQGLLSSRRGADGAAGRRRQQAKLGAFYTPHADVEYMVGKLALTRDAKVLDPCMGSGHFLEGVFDALADRYEADGFAREDAYREIVGQQVWGGDIDTFATSLAAIRLFLLDEHDTKVAPNLFVHDMLLHSPERPGAELFSPELLEAEGRARATPERAASIDPGVDEPAQVDDVVFDAVVGNPPYGARKPAYKVPVYRRLYGGRAADLKAGSVGTGDGDTYSMFFVNGIERLREGGRLCLITNDSFRSLTTHAALRRHILDSCKIVEILLTDTKHFGGVSFQFAGMAITTLEKCSDAAARRDHVMRLVDYVRNPADFADPPPDRVFELRQAEYEALAETPFFVGVPEEVVEAVKGSVRVGDFATGRQGLATADDKRFLAGIGHPFPGLRRVIESADLAGTLTDAEQRSGVAAGRPAWVPFAKGEGFGEYWRDPQVAIDWSRGSVEELERRDRQKAGTPRKPRLQNRRFYFKAGLTYSVVSSGRISVRLMPAGGVFGHKGSAVFVDDDSLSERFMLGYLNSTLATYLLKRVVNTTATADVGYIEKLPFRRPDPETHDRVVALVDDIVAVLQADPRADISSQRTAIDDAVFDLFEIRASRDEIRRFYDAVGRAEPKGTEA